VLAYDFSLIWWGVGKVFDEGETAWLLLSLLRFNLVIKFQHVSNNLMFADKESCLEGKMPHRTRPMTALLVFTGLNVILVSTITPVYYFVCFLPHWERRVRL
jgi:hypothetical protein